jgi:hypothetical protein
MAQSDTELLSEIRDFGSSDIEGAPDAKLQTGISRAKKHLKLEAQIPADEVDWYGNELQEEALFWASVLFSKVQTGALDSKAVSVGAIEENQLLAKGDEATFWYERYDSALSSLTEEFNSGTNVSRVARTSDDAGVRNYDTRR